MIFSIPSTPRRLLALLVAASCGAALAGPTSPVVVNGQATFNQQGNVFSITNTPNTVINWQSFSIAPGEITRFLQQSASSAVLNRITGQDPSQILGALQSNGQVLLINPNGIVFGRDARVDVGGLTASTLNLSNSDFLAGKRTFAAGDTAAAISNAGAITTPAGGKVFLLASKVDNSGVITSPQGQVVLAAGHSVTLADAGDPNLHVVLSAPADAAVNVGQVIAQGGKVGIYGALVSQRGVVNANGAVVGERGQIVFKALGDTVLDAGSSTTATGAGQGGSIAVLGSRVALTGDAQVDASGKLGGGSVLVGGDLHGANAAVPNATQTFVAPGAHISADALVSGDGGKVVVWADGLTRFYGSVSATGGALGGNGGFAEVSGKQQLVFDGVAQLGAHAGAGGTLLLDPNNLSITSDVTAGESGINALPVSAPFVVGDDGSANSTLQVSTLTNMLDGHGAYTGSAGSVQLQATGGITLNGLLTWTSNSALSLLANGGDISLAQGGIVNHTSASAVLSLNAAAGKITQSAPVQVANVAARASGDVVLTNTSNAVGTFAASGANISYNGAGTSPTSVGTPSVLTIGTVDGLSGTVAASAVTLRGGGLALTQPVTGTLGAVKLTAGTLGISQQSSGAVTTSQLEVIAGSAVDLSVASNKVGTAAAAVTGTGSTFAFANDNTPLTIGLVGSTSGIAAVGNVAVVQGDGSLTVSRNVSSGAGSTIALTAAGPNGDTLLISAGTTVGSAGSGAVTLKNDTGAISVAGSVMSGAEATLWGAHGLGLTSAGQIGAAGDVLLNAAPTTMIGTGPSTITLAAGATIATSGHTIELAANKMDLTGSTLTASGTNGLTALHALSSSVPISVAAANHSGPAGTLEITNADLTATAGSTSVRVGSNASGSMTIRTPLTAAIGSLSLVSDGILSQASGAYINGPTAVRLSGGTVTMLDANVGSTVISGTAQGNFQYRSTGAISVGSVGGVDGISGNTVTLHADGGGITQASTSPIGSAGALSLTALGNVTLTHTDNNVASVDANLTGGGNLNVYSAGALAVDALTTSSGKSITVASSGALSVNGAVNAGGGNAAVDLRGASVALGASTTIDGSTISLRATDATTGVLTNLTGTARVGGSSTTDVTLAADGFDFTHGSTPTINASHAIVATTTSDNAAMTTAGLTSASLTTPLLQLGNAVAADSNTTGNLTVNSALDRSGSTLVLAAGGAITQTAPLAASALLVTTGSSGSVTLTNASNTVLALAGNTNGGALSYRDGGGVTIGSVANAGGTTTTGLSTGSGSATLTALGGNVTVGAALTAGALQLTSSQGNVSGSGISATSLQATAAGAVNLTSAVVSFGASTTAFNSNISLTNTGALHLTGISQGGAGSVTINNTGAVTVDSATSVSSHAGAIAITAHSPLTVDGAVSSSAGGAINLQAGSSGSVNDKLTVSSTGSVTTTGAITLTAGDAINIVGTVTPGHLTLRPFQNTPPPPVQPEPPPLPSLGACIATPSLAGCDDVLPSVAQCTITPTAAGCSVVLPSLSACTISPTTAGCSVVLPTLAVCTSAPATAGCSVVLPTLAFCTIAPRAAGCSAVLPTVAQCVAAPAIPGCSAVLPTLSACIASPTTAGCSVVLPTLAACTVTPALNGCSVVLPTVAACVASPTLAGCSTVLPSLAACTATPSLAGCSAVLPTLASCTAVPTLAGCVAILPTLSACTAASTLAGCSAVLPTLSACTAVPTLAGCGAVLPSVAACTITPTLGGCAAVLPSLAVCTAAPSTAGCSAVLPTLASCTAMPTLPGCSAVLPSLAVCTATPTLAGCAAVLPSVAICTAAPTTAGCAAVLPTVPACVANSALRGCSVVLPTLAVCTAAPSTAGCSVVLPSFATCVSAPNSPGCSAVLPTLSSCVATPSLAGCSAVLPTLSQCQAAPTLAGCTAVLPTLAQCEASPTLQGCTQVIPPATDICTIAPNSALCQVLSPPIVTTPVSPVSVALNNTVNLINTSTAYVVGGGASVDKAADKTDTKEVASNDLAGTKNEPTKKMYCN